MAPSSTSPDSKRCLGAVLSLTMLEFERAMKFLYSLCSHFPATCISAFRCLMLTVTFHSVNLELSLGSWSEDESGGRQAYGLW
jgi:hypothetical protein